ncbi:putative cycloisomaltooligosaccharide glucanotransferase [Methylobacterium sp. ME121]|nr:putative cycloisomaltooligosaccharide glucanotransferase [Methylobacterium sp. ME121]
MLNEAVATASPDDDHPSHLVDTPTPRRRGRGPDKGPRIQGGAQRHPLKRAGRRYEDTLIAFTPRSEAAGFRSTVGQIKLGPYPDKTGWADAYACHIGGPELTIHCPNKAQIDALVLRDFHLLVAEHGMKPVDVHNALMDLIEFRRAIHESAYGAVAQGKARDTNAADRPL